MLESSQTTSQTLIDLSAWLSATAGRRPRIGPLRGGVAAGRFQHSEWTALLSLFVEDGRVDYGRMRRVRRLVEVYLHQLVEHDPERFIDADDQLAFYLNAYNAIAIHQVLLHYPLASLRAIPAAFVRLYPVGRRNVSLHALHGGLLRAFGDPRIHVALSPAALGGPALQPHAFTGAQLQAQLDAALRRFLADSQRGLRYDPASHTLWLSPILRWFGGDFVRPPAMPRLDSLLIGWAQPAAVLSALRPYLPAELAAQLDARPTLRLLPFDWRLNDQAEALTSAKPAHG